MGVIQNNWATTDWCRYSYCVPTGYEALGAQVRLVTPGVQRLGIQVRLVAYNITNLRILWEMKSDGTTSNNFTASSEASTDKGVVNLKSDVIEKYWQSTSASTQWVQWDAGSGRTISLDTLALIGHNLTSSAVVTLIGYGGSGDSAPANTAAWDALDAYATLTLSDDPDEENLIYIHPNTPANSYRHWRLKIHDPTNPDAFLRAGRLVAGSALVFNGENCLDEIELTNVNYKDETRLNGFAGIANNRALKKNLALKFRNLDRVSLTNYRLLRRYLQYCRDTLKALIIVDPSSETAKYQFTAFAKLKQMPREMHKYIDENSSYTSLELEYDEGR